MRLRFIAALLPYAPMSRKTPRITQNQPHPVKPTPGIYARTYIKVVNGKKIIPSSGTMNVSNAR